MAITPAYCVDEEELESLKSLLEEGNDEIDQDIEDITKRYLSRAAKLQGLEIIPPEEVAWAAGLEGDAMEMAEFMGELAESIRRGVAVLALRPGEEATVEALLRQAKLADARRADAEELVAATRRLQEKDLRRLAAAEHLVDPSWLLVVKCMAEYLVSSLGDGQAPTPREVAVAAGMEAQIAGAYGRMASLAGRLRRGAAEFAARPGEEALVGALQRQADKADAVRATIEAFTDSLRRFQDAGALQPNV